VAGLKLLVPLPVATVVAAIDAAPVAAEGAVPRAVAAASTGYLDLPKHKFALGFALVVKIGSANVNANEMKCPPLFPNSDGLKQVFGFAAAAAAAAAAAPPAVAGAAAAAVCQPALFEDSRLTFLTANPPRFSY